MGLPQLAGVTFRAFVLLKFQLGACPLFLAASRVSVRVR